MLFLEGSGTCVLYVGRVVPITYVNSFVSMSLVSSILAIIYYIGISLNNGSPYFYMWLSNLLLKKKYKR